jgi:hypothetical protein
MHETKEISFPILVTGPLQCHRGAHDPPVDGRYEAHPPTKMHDTARIGSVKIKDD